MVQPQEPTFQDSPVKRQHDPAVSQLRVDTGRIREIAALTYGTAEAYIALGQRMFEEAARRPNPRTTTRLPPQVVRELDLVSEHLLALATHLARLATVIEQAGPPRTTGPKRG